MRKMTFAVTLLCGLLAFSSAFAAKSDSITPPDKVVEQATSAVLGAIRAHKDQFQGHPEAVYQLVEKQLAPHFDFKYAARLVLGRYWRDASSKQRSAFIDAFKHYLVNSYASELVKHADAKVKVQPFRGSASDERADITSIIVPKDGKPLRVHYAMVRTKDGWKAFDVRAEGVSYVMSYRNTFGSEIQDTSLDALIKRLQQKAHKKAESASQKAGASDSKKETASQDAKGG